MELKKLAPNFAVPDIEKTVAFYRDMLGFKLEIAVPEDKSGVEQELGEKKKYIYAMMSRDGVGVMFQRMDNKGWDEEIAKRKAIDKLHVVGKGISQVIEEFLVNAKRERLEKEMNTR